MINTMILLIVIVFLLPCIGTSRATLCPLVFAQKDFNITEYAGLWYEAYRHDANEVDTKCKNGTYTVNSNGTMDVLSEGLNKLTGYYSNQGLAIPKRLSEPAAFLIHDKNPTKTVKYNIIQTNYQQYSLIYSCDYVPIIGIRFEHIWFLSRNKTFPEPILDKFKKVLKHIHVESSGIESTPQDC
ncbi:unnamed protein product [Rotaria socialis]|uniref:Lipocalin/cytosolic fatty-acid binding domain-containing protein n=1 Tax=Rotaria socialis TaxID=392032 RepID=A0A821EM06_9BILA|nr:unnamed protein product [Rotaria socialis]